LTEQKLQKQAYQPSLVVEGDGFLPCCPVKEHTKGIVVFAPCFSGSPSFT
jgi:hypothetical protein